MIKFTVPGEPQGKARARTGKGFAYTPEKTVLYENLIKTMYMQAKCTPIEAEKAIKMNVKAYYAIPKSYTKGKRLSAEHNIIRPLKKPDIDNVLKVIADALNGVAYHDDTQIVKAEIAKYYGEPRLEIEVETV